MRTLMDDRDDQLKALSQALRFMLEEKIEYMRINNLGDPEKQRTVIMAREALDLANA